MIVRTRLRNQAILDSQTSSQPHSAHSSGYCECGPEISETETWSATENLSVVFLKSMDKSPSIWLPGATLALFPELCQHIENTEISLPNRTQAAK